MEAYRVVRSDLLIIGSESAGAMAALHAAKSGLQVTIVNKDAMARGGVTVLAVFSCNAALGIADGRDNPEVHFRDTVDKGRYINDRRLVKMMAEEAPERLMELGSYGLRWTRRGGKIEQVRMPGHTYARSLHVGLSTGIRMMRVLKAQVSKHSNIKVMNNILVTNLMTDDNGEVIGAAALDLMRGEMLVLLSRATIIAAGGGMYIYYYNSAVPGSTGDGYAYAYRVGAELVDMEFVQFFPTGGLFPPSLMGRMGPGNQRYFLNAFLYNAEGERFMRRYEPEGMEKSTRDILSWAIYSEVRAGRGSPHGGVWLDCSYLPRNLIDERVKNFMGSWRWAGIDMLAYGLDIREKAVEVIPVAHYFMGGVKVDETCSTRVPGLFAAGEAVGGTDGANRIEGNALSICLVTGAKAGIYAAKFAQSRPMPEVNNNFVKEEMARVFAPLEHNGGEDAVLIRRELQREMWDNAGIIRSGAGLRSALNKIEDWKRQKIDVGCKARRYNKEWQEALALANMLEVAEMICRVALLRKESRGAHYREDYPETDDENWLANVVIKRDGQLLTSRVPVKEGESL